MPGGISGVRVLRIGGWTVQWLVVAAWAAIGVSDALSTDWHRHEALLWLCGALFMAMLILERRANDRLRETCGTGREADETEHRNGGTIRYWYGRRK